MSVESVDKYTDIIRHNNLTVLNNIQENIIETISIFQNGMNKSIDNYNTFIDLLKKMLEETKMNSNVVWMDGFVTGFKTAKEEKTSSFIPTGVYS